MEERHGVVLASRHDDDGGAGVTCQLKELKRINLDWGPPVHRLLPQTRNKALGRCNVGGDDNSVGKVPEREAAALKADEVGEGVGFGGGPGGGAAVPAKGLRDTSADSKGQAVVPATVARVLACETPEGARRHPRTPAFVELDQRLDPLEATGPLPAKGRATDKTQEGLGGGREGGGDCGQGSLVLKRSAFGGHRRRRLGGRVVVDAIATEGRPAKAISEPLAVTAERLERVHVVADVAQGLVEDEGGERLWEVVD